MKQAEFEFVKDVRGREWDYCVLVTNDEKMDAVAPSQLYRDRGDCENNFDEFKNLNIDATTFQHVVLTLHMCDMIEEEMLSRRKTVYTLKTAA